MKKICCLLSLMLGVTLLAGCGNNPPPDDNTIDPSDVVIDIPSDIEAELSITVPGGNVNERTMINCLIDDFALMYPNVTISMNYVSVNNYVSAVTQQALGNALPDIIWSNSPDFYDLVKSNIFVNLDPYIQASEMAGQFNFEEDFYTEYFDMGSSNGKHYVVPRSCDSIVTFLNTKILEDAGVDLNKDTTKVKNGWTWDDFMSVCAQVRAYYDANGMSDCYVIDANLTSWLSVCYPMLISYGAEVISEDGKNVISSDATKACLEMVREMVDKRYINDSTVATTKSFENGGSAMLFQSASVSLYAEKQALKGNVDLVSFPLITKNNTPKIGAGIAGYAITKNCTNKDLAWQFLVHLLSREGQNNMAKNGLNLASIRKDLSDYTQAEWGKKYSSLNLAAYTYGSEYKISTDFFVRTDLSAKAGIQSAITTMFNGASNASKDIDKVIKTAKDDIDDAMQGY